MSFGGLGYRYDRRLSSAFSLGGNLFGNFTASEMGGVIEDYSGVIGLVATLRFFPLRSFYIELGAGGGWSVRDRGSGGNYRNVFGFMLAPAAGWKIDFGRPGGFFINPFVSFPITIGNVTRWNYYGDRRRSGGALHHIRFGIGLGRAF